MFGKGKSPRDQDGPVGNPGPCGDCGDYASTRDNNNWCAKCVAKNQKPKSG